jgi:hypothetical protein
MTPFFWDFAYDLDAGIGVRGHRQQRTLHESCDKLGHLQRRMPCAGGQVVDLMRNRLAERIS